MTFEINYNTPISHTRSDGTRVGIVVGTNLTADFFSKAGVSNLPEGVTVYWGGSKDHSTYTISGPGGETKIDAQQSDAKSLVAQELIRRGSTPVAAI